MAKMKYKISSRATILLGRESVAKVDGAIIELVKNTYDADALLCLICFDISNNCIYILDNGTGMTQKTIEDYWMLIGTDNKKSEYESERKRIKSGEKGIGRFALDRLGSKCEMYTRNKKSPNLIYWKTDWSDFEKPGAHLGEMEADFDFLDMELAECLPPSLTSEIIRINKSKTIEEKIKVETGTMLKISGLRDKWSDKEIINIIDAMGFLIPPVEQKDYIIALKKSLDEPAIIIENEISEEYDYKLNITFDGDIFNVILNRNEFDLNKIPADVFELESFKEFPYEFKDFKKESIELKYEIHELMHTTDEEVIKSVKEIGPFKFKYTFMKLSLNDDSKEVFFYKEISKKRRVWLENHGGIKIYRDNFLVRPYGDQTSESFDWLGLDARKANSPAAISHPSGKWRVRNRQGQGTIMISRVDNSSILDKSSREGIIENDHFKLFKKIITNLIQIFEEDRAHIGRGMKEYSDKVHKKEKAKQEGKSLADKVLKETPSKEKNSSKEEVKTLAKAVQYYEEEREELITEIKLLRSLATNGLITTSVVHDLKGINAILVNRVDNLRFVINKGNADLINRHLEDLERYDVFLKSWISVITNQIKKDKRRRLKKNIYQTIQEIIDVLKPILNQKKINIRLKKDKNQTYKRIFVSDFESIIYNLIINSIEAFENAKVLERTITISLETNESIIIHYQDNGDGLPDSFKNPYDIFTFGTTSKYDKEGEKIGTGLGMYIVSSTAREYNAQIIITNHKNGFGLDLKFPL
ncbi:sensor histidine kinase [Paenibacillus polymyxa]|uniref:ATP-binding protein n=1 Tax=Paenibacillus polymyxa TaxID=1406 RepID=UPI001BEB2254|nr:sensor histidine kinase [Paenibacillus polymyxa]MBT2285810.1 sensor histidine kinase [Paenibacillus polymyxa]